MGKVKLFIIAVLIIFSGCSLLYPPQFYDKIVQPAIASSKGNSGGGGPKTWQTIGDSGFSGVMPASSLRILIDANGNPYVAFLYQSNLFLYSNAPFWSYNPSANNGIVFMSFTLINNMVPYFYITDGTLSQVLYYQAVWNALGNQFSASQPAAITSWKGTPAFAYYDSVNYIYYGYYDSSASNFPGTSITGSSIDLVDLQYSDPVFFNLYHQGPSVGPLSIRSGSNENALANGTASVITPSFMGQAFMATAHGIAYIGLAASGTSIDVTSYDSNLNVFSLGSIVRTNFIYNPSIAAQDASHIYVAFSEQSAMNIIKVYAYNGTSWSELGGDPGYGSVPSVAVAPDGTVYVAYLDSTVNNFVTVKAYK